jgi:hypothetical protein
MMFYPWLPFGFEQYKDPDTGVTSLIPDGQSINACYTNSLPNPGFWGWTNLKNLLQSVITTATSNSLTVEELDLQNEVDLASYPVMARLIYDNTTSTPVRTFMALSAPLTLSVSAAGAPATPGDCGSFYGDSALLLRLDEVIAATAGYAFGGQLQTDINWNGSVPCSLNFDLTGLVYAPAGQPISTVLDIHSTPGCYNAQSPGECDQSNASQEQGQAQTFFNDFWSLMSYRQITTYTAMFGELPNNQAGCDYQTQQDASTAAGGYLESTLYSNAASHTVLRPWENSVTPAPLNCSGYVIPANIGAPSGPYAR